MVSQNRGRIKINNGVADFTVAELSGNCLSFQPTQVWMAQNSYEKRSLLCHLFLQLYFLLTQIKPLWLHAVIFCIVNKTIRRIVACTLVVLQLLILNVYMLYRTNQATNGEEHWLKGGTSY